MAFVKASRSKTYLKIALQGVAGSGKTLSAILLAKGLSDDGRVALIDTENKSGSLYSDRYDYDVDDITPPYDPEKFNRSFNEAVEAGYCVVILDSASHVWEGVLAIKSELDARPKANSFTNWNEAGKRFKSVLDTILQSPVHVICCLRSKTEYVLQDDNGKKVPKKLGTAPVMRDNIEYEFSTVFEIDGSHLAYSDKDRTELFINKPPFKITEETGRKLKGWLTGSDANKQETKLDDRGKLIIWLNDMECAGRAYSFFVSKGWLQDGDTINSLSNSIATQLLAKKDELILKLKDMEEGK